MAEVNPVQPAGDGDPAQQGNQDGQTNLWTMVKGFISRALMIYFITSLFRRGQTPTTPAVPGGAPAAPVMPTVNLFSDGTRMDLYIYSSIFEDISEKFPTDLLWKKPGLVYGDWTSGPDGDGCHHKSLTFPTTPELRNNGSIWLHAFIVREGASPDPQNEHHSPLHTVHVAHRLNKFLKMKYSKTANLITGQTDKSEIEIKKAETVKEEILSHWHPNITINIVHDFTQWVPGSIPQPLTSYIQFTPTLDGYKPIVFANPFWALKRDFTPINETVKSLNLSLTFQPLGMFKFQMYASQLSKQKWGGSEWLENLQGENDDSDSDAMKEALTEMSIPFLVFTGVASLLHTIFEMLAFKNDIQFWNNRQSLEGLSVRSVFFNVFQSVIVLLYVCDNETNFLIKISCFVELCIQIWKISKIKSVKLDYSNKIYGLPRLTFEDREDICNSETDKYDRMAFKYVGWGLFPLLGAYVVYSLVYYEHKGWYSFVLSMLYGFLLTFGFIKMTPQLFINYKMKSVAHLPWRMLTYKALNTFIDDIFAFVIKMPTMYRIGCLRDDIVFIIFLYQRYIYRIDPSRVNEFGFSKEMEEKVKNQGQVENQDQKSIEDKKED